MSTAEFHYLCGKYVAERERVLGLKNQSVLSAAYTNGVRSIPLRRATVRLE